MIPVCTTVSPVKKGSAIRLHPMIDHGVVCINLPSRTTASVVLVLMLTLPLFVGCQKADPNKPSATSASSTPVVVYVSVDRAFAEPLLAQFAEQLGIVVKPVFDTEASKTTGLVNRLRTERARPRADVWWSSEIYGTIELAREEIFAPYVPSTASDIPDAFRATDGLWTAFGLRGRVLAYRKPDSSSGDAPQHWWDLIDPKYKERIAMADPRFGTTRGHMATLLSTWGERPFRVFLEGLKANRVKRATGNSHAVILVRRKVVYWGMTDTDDVIVAQARGDDIEMEYPTMAIPSEHAHGDKLKAGRLDAPLWIPCSVALVNGSRNPAGAKKLIDLICSAATEEALYQSESRNIPVRAALRAALGIDVPPAAKVDYADAAAKLTEARRIIDEVGVFE